MTWNSYYRNVEPKRTEVSEFLRRHGSELTEDQQVSIGRMKTLAETWKFMNVSKVLLQLLRYKYSRNYDTSILIMIGNIVYAAEQYANSIKIRRFISNFSSLIACRLGGMTDHRFYEEFAALKVRVSAPEAILGIGMVDREIANLIIGVMLHHGCNLLSALEATSAIYDRILSLSPLSRTIGRVNVYHELRKLIGNPFENESSGPAEGDNKEPIWVNI